MKPAPKHFDENSVFCDKESVQQVSIMSSKFLVLLIAAFGFSAAAADVYTWVDDEGQVHFSDKPDELPAQVVSVQSRPTDLSRVSRQAQDDQYLSEAADLRKQQQAEDAGNEDRIRQETLAERAAACDKARQRNESYSSSHRLYRPTAEGGRDYLSNEEIDAARAEALAAVDEWCS